MSDSSAESAATLALVRPRQVLCLLDLLQASSVRSPAYIGVRFGEQAPNYSETLRLVEDFGWVLRQGDSLQLGVHAARIVAAPVGQRELVLAETMLWGLGPYERIFARYLGQFALHAGELVCWPEGERRLRESPVRDFLMELGAVSHRSGDDSYVLAEPFAFLRLWARNVLGPADPAELEQRGRERQELGLAAELVVVAWEKQRVGLEHAARVRHVAAQSPASCYDLESVTLEGPDAGLRFIEVKAVAADTYQFHWTGAELEAARLLGGRYFLYLLPVRGANCFALEKMEIIQNPFAVVYQNPALWSKSEAVIVCQKREPPHS